MYQVLPYFVSFFIGAIPVGFLLARAKGIDVRSAGSGNIGATNVARVVGKSAGIITLFFDILKGSIASLGVAALVYPAASTETIAVHGVFAVLGHCYSPFLAFRGGKGVATALGVFVVISPLATAIALTVFACCLKLTRYVSLASVCAAITHPLSLWILLPSGASVLTLVSSALVAMLIVLRHKKNIQRLLAGSENRINDKQTPESSSSTP